MPAGGLLISGGIGLAESAIGLFGKNKAKKEAERLAATRPKYTESPYAKDQLALTQSELSTGMSGEAKTAYEEGIDKDLSGSLSAILKGGGSSNNIAEVFSAANGGRQRLAIMKDNLRLNQINNVVRAQDFSSQEREKEFQFNDWAPWADAAKANAGARTEADDMFKSGLGTFGAAAASYAGLAKGKSDLNATFSQQNNGPGYTSVGTRVQPTGATGPGNFAPGFIAPSVPTVDFSQISNIGLPTISSFE